jgi:hypothetical protein
MMAIVGGNLYLHLSQSKMVIRCIAGVEPSWTKFFRYVTVYLHVSGRYTAYATVLNETIKYSGRN